MQQNIKEHRYTTIEAFRNDIKQVLIFVYFLLLERWKMAVIFLNLCKIIRWIFIRSFTDQDE